MENHNNVSSKSEYKLAVASLKAQARKAKRHLKGFMREQVAAGNKFAKQWFKNKAWPTLKPVPKMVITKKEKGNRQITLAMKTK